MSNPQIIPAPGKAFTAIFHHAPGFMLRHVIAWRMFAYDDRTEAHPVCPGLTWADDERYMGVIGPDGVVFLKDGRTYEDWARFLRAEGVEP